MRAKRTCLPSCRLIWNRRGTAFSATAKASVELEICYRSKRKWVTTNIILSAKEWDQKRSRVKNHADMLSLNERLALLLDRCECLFAECMRSGIEFNFNMVQPAIDGKSAILVVNEKPTDKWKDCDFIGWIEDRIKNRSDLRASTLKTHESFLNILREYNSTSVCQLQTFGQLNKKNIMQWDNWLHNRKKSDNTKLYQQTTIYGYHKRMKRYINEALKMEMIEKNPYDMLHIDRGKSSGIRYLTKQQVWKLRDLAIAEDRIKRVRDLYVFQCYTGLAYADLSNFDFSHCIERNGRYWLRDNRLKSEEEYSILLLPTAVDILKRYDFHLPLISNQQYNLCLKALAAIANININLTTHTARHTFACMILNEGVEISTLAKMMGHANTNTTQIYAKVLASSVESAFISLEDKI